MKRWTVLLLVLLLAVFSAACAPAPAAVTPAPEAPLAPAQPAEPETPVLLDPGTEPVVPDDNALSWPEGDAGLRVPEFQGGTIASVLDNGDNCTVTITGAAQAEYDTYVAELEEAGFTSDVNEVKQDSMHMYSASSEDNYYASVALSDGQIVVSAEFLG